MNENEILRLVVIPGFGEKFDPDTLNTILSEVSLEEKSILLFGKEILQPRLVSYQGDPDAFYTYSGRKLSPQPWTPKIDAIKNSIEEDFGVRFNSCLINYYRNGRDSMGWHSDNEPELGTNPLIASISFGENRAIQFKPKKGIVFQAFSVPQPDGTLIFMAGNTQKFFLHSIPKSNRTQPRLNLTFRRILT